MKEKNVLLVGSSGSGKSALAGSLLNDRLFVNYRLIQAGDYFRSGMSELGLSVQSGDSIPLALDRLIDTEMLSLMEGGGSYIMTGRTLSMLALHEPNLERNVLRVGIQCPYLVRARRAQKKWLVKMQNREGDDRVSNDVLPSLIYVLWKLLLRDSKDMWRYQQLYGDKRYNYRWGMDLAGSRFNELVLNSSQLTIKQELELVIRLLANNE